jgi:hypothetical protein
LFSKAATQRMHETFGAYAQLRRISSMQEQLGENRYLKGKHKAHHPFEDGGIGLII